MTETCWLVRSDVYFRIRNLPDKWFKLQLAWLKARTSQVPDNKRSTGEGQRCMLRIMWVTWALETILLLGFSCCTLSIVVMWCASRIPNDTDTHIQTYPYVCRWNEWNGKPLPGADRNSGSPLRRWGHRHSGAHSRSDKGGRGSEEKCRKWKRFMTVYRCLWQKIF